MGNMKCTMAFTLLLEIMKKLIVSMFGLDSRQYDISNFFDPKKADGKWFLNYQNNSEELLKKFSLVIILNFN